VNDAAPRSSADGAFLHRTQRVMRFAVDGLIPSTIHARVYQRGGWRLIKYILDYVTRPTCALLHRNKHATASAVVSALLGCLELTRADCSPASRFW
jgi:hypothetical protein